jgi:hypothetical protein
VTTDGIVAVGNADGGPAAWYSGDGMTWTRAYVEDFVVDSDFYGEMTASRLAQVFESDGQLLAIGLPSLGMPIGFISADGGRTWLQDDRFVWHEDPERWSGGSAFITDVVSTPAGWAAAGHRATPGWAMYLPWHVGWSSPDGHEWSVMDADASLLGHELDQGAEVGALAVDDGIVFAVGSSIWTSEVGGRWKEEEPPIPLRRGELDGVADDDGVLIVSENYGDDEQESLGGRIWARVSGSWREELSIEPPSSIDALAEYSFGVIAAGTRDGLPVGWQRHESGKWLELPTFETEPGWVGAAVEFQGRLLISGSLTEADEEGLEVSRQAVVWIGMPPSAPPANTPAPAPAASPMATVCRDSVIDRADGYVTRNDIEDDLAIIEAALADEPTFGGVFISDEKGAQSRLEGVLLTTSCDIERFVPAIEYPNRLRIVLVRHTLAELAALNEAISQAFVNRDPVALDIGEVSLDVSGNQVRVTFIEDTQSGEIVAAGGIPPAFVARFGLDGIVFDLMRRDELPHAMPGRPDESAS